MLTQTGQLKNRGKKSPDLYLYLFPIKVEGECIFGKLYYPQGLWLAEIATLSYLVADIIYYIN